MSVRRIILIVIAAALVAYIAWDRVEARRLSRAIAAIAARGEPVSSGDGFAAPKTAEQRQAATLYAQAAEIALQHEIDDNHRSGRLDVDKPGGAELSIDDIRQNYPDNDEALQLLDRATRLDFGGFDAEQRRGDSFQQSNLEMGLDALGSLACLRADLASVRGDADGAVAALVPCIRLQRTFDRVQQRADHGGRIVASLRILFRHVSPSDRALLRLERALDSWPEEDELARAVMLERAQFLEVAAAVRSYPAFMTRLLQTALHPFVLRSERRTLAEFDWPIAIAHLPWSERWSQMDVRQREIIGVARRRASFIGRTTDLFAGMSWGSMFPMNRAAYDLVERRIAGAVVATERYRRAHDGVPPASIHAGEDPFSGKPLIFKRDADGYLIYSVDVNRKDDGGILYGFGAAGLTHYGQQTPRDFGIRVPFEPR